MLINNSAVRILVHQLNLRILNIDQLFHLVDYRFKLSLEIIDIVVDQVLAVNNGELKVGNPTIAGASVTATVLEEGKNRKVIVYKYKRKTGYHKKNGHRQAYTCPVGNRRSNLKIHKPFFLVPLVGKLILRQGFDRIDSRYRKEV